MLEKAPRQECIWNSGMLAKIAERVIGLEEGGEGEEGMGMGIGEGMREEGIGEGKGGTSRVSVLNATICSGEGGVLLECLQRGEGGERQVDEWIVY